ncbi:MAG TPA: GNAT family N-acetyltransferase [Deinococcales bacterium]|nr:GNAT family N-acetyltransferase [Deinococcales bacterium]
MSGPITLEPLTLDTLDEAVSVYARTWDRDEYAARLHFERHRLYPMWRGLLARKDRRAIGFVYGNQSLPGQWWHDVVSRHLRDREVLRDAWVLSELAVAPGHRDHGLGGWLHDEVLSGLPFRHAVLSTQLSNAGAQRFYHRRGWRTVVPEIRFSVFDEPFTILARDLPLEGGSR